MAKICSQTERFPLSAEASNKALKLNPFLWTSFTELCHRNENPDPNTIFQINSTEVFQTCQAQNINSIICQNSNINGGDINTTTNNLDFHNNTILTTPVDQIISQQCIIQTPNLNTIQYNTMSSLRTGVLFDDTPLGCNNISDSDSGTPFRKQFKYLTAISPSTPSFGILPMSSPNDSTFNSSSPTPFETIEQKSISKKLKSHVGSLINRKDTPLQQTKPVFSQTGNITPRTPNTITGQNVRRSSRLFSTNYSVKENNKSPNINKFAAPRSPPRKSKQRSKINLNNELNEKKEKIETITSSTDCKVLLNNSINSAQTMAQQLLNLKKQSVEGLMSLLKDLGNAYLLQSKYDNKEAIEYFNALPVRHFKSSWVQGQIALAHYEQRDYNSAVNIFQEIHEIEPNRMELLEIYSTSLWHLQKEVALSTLAQDLMLQDKKSAITWCVAGNCFSLHKEHETAIQFFQRAVQCDPEFPYSYTLLGHELVMTEELDKALSCFRTAILKDSRHYNAWFGIGTIFSKQERYQLAEIHYRRALKINPKSSVIMVHIGAMQFLLQKTEQALQTLNAAIILDPKNPLCKFQRGSLYFSMGRHHEALKELEELKQIVPRESVVYYLIGKIHKKLGNVDSALMHFSWASDLDPKGANNQIKDAFDSNISQGPNADLNNASENDADQTSEPNEVLLIPRILQLGNEYESDEY